MSITALDYLLFRAMKVNRDLPAGPKILDFGENNWYGDVPVETLIADLRQFMGPGEKLEGMLARVRAAAAMERSPGLYEMARLFFEGFLDCREYAAIDTGSPSAKHRFDLNLPVPLEERFDLTVNLGTAEHLFNVAELFRSMHDRTLPGGLMIHAAPCTGWADHGFFCFQPTLFIDVARVNGYRVLYFLWGKINPLEYVEITSHEDFCAKLDAGAVTGNTNIHIVFRKALGAAGEKAFVVPIQRVYSGAASQDLMNRWRSR